MLMSLASPDGFQQMLGAEPSTPPVESSLYHPASKRQILLDSRTEQKAP
jgi:hypothetical protein